MKKGKSLGNDRVTADMILSGCFLEYRRKITDVQILQSLSEQMPKNEKDT